MLFQDIKPGTKFVPFPGQPDRIFFKIQETDTEPYGWQRDWSCGTCGQKPIQFNAFEYGGKGKLYHHFCPGTRLARVDFTGPVDPQGVTDAKSLQATETL